MSHPPTNPSTTASYRSSTWRSLAYLRWSSWFSTAEDCNRIWTPIWSSVLCEDDSSSLVLFLIHGQQGVFQRFATGVDNLLIATKSMEDLDIPKASVVIRWALHLHFHEFVLSSICKTDTISSKVKYLMPTFVLEQEAGKAISFTWLSAEMTCTDASCLV